MIRTTSVTELRDKLAETLDSLGPDSAVMVVRHSQPAAYLISPELFESLIERIEDLEDRVDMATAMGDYHQGQAIEAEDVFGRLGL
jgi:prevent-host-death family protein